MDKRVFLDSNQQKFEILREVNKRTSGPGLTRPQAHYEYKDAQGKLHEISKTDFDKAVQEKRFSFENAESERKSDEAPKTIKEKE